MKHHNGRTVGTYLFLLLMAFLVAGVAFAQEDTISPQQPQPIEPLTSLTGQISVIYAIPMPGSAAIEQTHYLLTTEDGQSYELDLSSALDAAGGVQNLGGQQATVTGRLAGEQRFGGPVAGSAGMATLNVETLSPLGETIEVQSPTLNAPTLSGAQPWVSILCKFADIPGEPRDLAYFQNLHGAAYPGLDHYWREASFDQMNLAGSNAFGWFTLPQSRSAYFFEGQLSTVALFWDCINTADPTVNFADYIGIRLMFNDSLGCCSHIGWNNITLDGKRILWKTTLEAPFTYTDVAYSAQIMGLAMGMQRTFVGFVQSQATYQSNVWDVISVAQYNCPATQHPTLGCIPQHPNGVNRDRMGWIPPNRLFEAPLGTQTITLEQLTQPPAGNYLLAKIPVEVDEDQYYTLEVRRPVGYDVKLPGSAVIIHKVVEDQNLFDGSPDPAPIMDADGNGNTGDAGAMWTVGETFTDAINGVTVSIESATATGFVVTITREPRGRIYVSKSVDPHPSPEAFTFSSTYAGQFQLHGLETFDSGPIPTGLHSVSEIDIPAGWTLTDISCTPGIDPAAIQLDDGEVVGCDFHNHKMAGFIFIRKMTSPPDAPEQFTFTPSYGTPFQLGDGGQGNSGPLAPGVYSVAETDLPPDWTLESATCDDGSDPSAITVADNEGVTCTFVNTGPGGRIVVAKETNPNGAAGTFTFTTSYAGQFQLSDGQSHDSRLLLAGTYSVSESNLPAGWELESATCSDGSTPGAINLAVGEVVTCTFVNNRPPGRIIVQKDATPPDMSVLFTFSTNYAGQFQLRHGESHTSAPLAEGVYSIAEINLPPGWTVDPWFCSDGSVPSAVNLSPGETVTCTFFNDGPPIQPNDPYEPNNAPGQATPIAYGQTKTGAFIGVPGDLDYFTFSGVAGDAIVATVEAQVNGSSLDSILWLYSSNGTTVLASNDDATGFDSQIQFTLPANGVYYLKVQDFGHPNTGGSAYFYNLRLNGTAPPASPSFYVSPATAGTVGGVSATPQDILFRNGAANTWAMHFDGSDVNVTKALSAFARLPNGDLLLVLKANQTLPGVGAVTPWDVVRFAPSEVGANTVGTFTWYIDGSDVGLTTAAEKIDALDILPDGRVLVSTGGALSAPKLGGGTLKTQDEDLAAFNPTSLGATTAGAWTLYFDGTAVPGLGGEDVAGAHVSAATSDLYLSITGAFNVGGVSGNGKDVLKLHPTGGGNYTVTRFWRGGDHGFNLNLGGIEVEN